MERTAGGQRTVPASRCARLLADRRHEEPIAAASARTASPGDHRGEARRARGNRGDPGRPHRVLAFITREAADQLGLEPGMEAVATVKATSVMVNLLDE